ncbi:MAG: MaoC family dehydratase N-terminal domain-containing protein [Actinobacteria bacterium]|nr:MaoC family dehydratase N-terminal domain-containing protein [Actinomycetota bacterium]
MAGDLALDFDALPEGARFRSRGRTIAEADLVAFAGLTGDYHPLHTDAEWAAESEFGGRVAHGMLLLSYCVGLAPFEPEYVLALRGFEKVAFKRPVRIGDTIRLEGEVVAKKELDGATGLVDFEWKLLNQRDELVARARPRVVWRRGVVAPAAPVKETSTEVYL